jgi:DNA polymerase V
MISLPFATNSSLTLSKTALQGLDLIYKSGISYKKAGVMVTGIVPEDTYQMTLFACENPKHHALMQQIDYLHKRFGPNKIKIANQDLSRTYKMKQAHLSPRYTTDVRDVIRVH